MRVCERFVRALMVAAGVCCLAASLASGQAAAPTVTVSPSSLIFAVPGTVSTASASQEITVSITGGSLPISISLSGAAFTETDTCGKNPPASPPSTIVAPPGCVIDVTYTPQSVAGTPETGTLTVNGSTVNLSGSLGAILLFKPVNVGTSNGNVSLTSLVTFNSTTLALSCPGGSTQKLSSTPDGGGFVMVDNFLTVQLGANPPTQTTVNGLVGNVCPGNLGNPADSGQPDCFTSSYQGNATTLAFGKNPDTFANPTNTILPGPGGVPPIDVTSNFANGGTTPTATFNMLDGGGEVGSTSLFLVTQCTPQGVTPGGTVTANPVNPQDPSTLSQASIFDSTNGQSISITTDVSNSPGSVAPGTQQVTTDFAIPQSLFNQLVAGTSAAPAVCLRLNGERDANGNAMCKGYLIQCWDPGHHTLTGDNCITTPSAARNLFDAAKFDSPDAPPNQNYLTAPASNPTSHIVSACAGVATGCAVNVIDPDPTRTMLVGPGILLGGDQWLCKPGSGNPPSVTCMNQQLDTSSPTPDGGNYTATNCVLTGTLGGDLCPLDTLTQFKGAADPVHGSTTTGKNSIFVPVVNVPLPFTQTTVTGRNANGWVNTPTVGATFISNQANYNPASTNPGANTFKPAPPYSLTYGFAPASSPAPDTTFPVSGDSTNYNAQTFPAFAAPLCTIGANGTPGQFPSQATPFTPNGLAPNTVPGVYNLHYFTTDCALTEELLFQPTMDQLTDASANWASFRTIAFGIDTSAPSLMCGAPTPDGSNGWYKTLPTVGCTANDDYSGFAGTTTAIANPGCDPSANPDCVVKKGLLTTSTSGTPSGTGAATVISVLPVQDLAGNASNTQGPYLTPIDNTVPTITAKFNASGTAFSVGQSVNVTLTCKDTGSGVGSCGGQPVSCPTAPAVGSASFTVTALPIDTTSGMVGPHSLNAVDCAGNVSGSINYTVAFGSAELAIATVATTPPPVKNGSNLTYKTFVLNIGPNAASNVVVTNHIPANTTYVSAISGIVSCTLSGCNDLTTGSSCSVSANVVTCSTPTIKPILSGLSGFVIKLVVKVSVPKGTTSVTDTATVASSNPDPIKGDNTATVSTKVTQ
jgi:uncharacterized repeat protein (TIGR01451 family)